METKQLMKIMANSFNIKPALVIMLAIMAALTVFSSSGRSQEATTTTELPEEIIKIAAVGDIMMGTEKLLPEDDGQGSFKAPLKYFKQCDIVFGNQEGTLTDRGKNTKVSKSGRSYSFKTPPHYGKYLQEAGFNMMSIANNHINDYGPEGRKMTIETLDKYGISWSGPPGTVATRTVRGLKIAMIAFYSGSGSHQLKNIPQAKKLVAKLAKANDIVMVSFHGGAEGRKYTHTPRQMEVFLGEQRGEVVKFSRAVIDAGADLVIGHGPHVPRAMEVYKDRLIAYSLGNFCTGKGINVQDVSGYAPLLLAELDREGRLTGGRIISFTQGFGQHPKLDSKKRAARLIHQLGAEDFPESNAVGPEGELIPASHK